MDLDPKESIICTFLKARAQSLAKESTVSSSTVEFLQKAEEAVEAIKDGRGVNLKKLFKNHPSL